MEELKTEIKILWIALILLAVVSGVLLATCDCPSQIVRGQIDDFMQKATSDPLEMIYPR